MQVLKRIIKKIWRELREELKIMMMMRNHALRMVSKYIDSTRKEANLKWSPSRTLKLETGFCHMMKLMGKLLRMKLSLSTTTRGIAGSARP